MPGAGLTSGTCAKALSDRPAFQPYWGKPAVRNDRGDGGNVGIIRSPLRATVLPDREEGDAGSPGRDSKPPSRDLIQTRSLKCCDRGVKLRLGSLV
jgi:hypothetical protein